MRSKVRALTVARRDVAHVVAKVDKFRIVNGLLLVWMFLGIDCYREVGAEIAAMI